MRPRITRRKSKRGGGKGSKKRRRLSLTNLKSYNTRSYNTRSYKRRSYNKSSFNINDESCQTPRCVSCRYFALKQYFARSMTIDEARAEIDKYASHDDSVSDEYDARAILYDPSKPLPDGFSVIFIVAKGSKINSPIHAFLLEKRSKHFYIYGSWGQFRSSSREEWEAYTKNMMNKDESYQDWDEYDISEISHMPTVQGPFTEHELKADFGDIQSNLAKLFGLTPTEIRCIHLPEIDIKIFK
jgi:hypothetical protein